MSDYNNNNRNLNDGFFEIKFQTDGVFLTVFPPVERGKRVEAKEIQDKLARKQVKNFNSGLIELAVTKADKVPLRIADGQEEIKVDAGLQSSYLLIK